MNTNDTIYRPFFIHTIKCFLEINVSSVSHILVLFVQVVLYRFAFKISTQEQHIKQIKNVTNTGCPNKKYTQAFLF